MAHALHGAAAASAHWTAFVARDGQDMCSIANTLWARNYFNKVTALHLGMTLHAVRHTWIGYGRRLCAAFVDSQDAQFKRLVNNANARMSVHNSNVERLTYAGEDGAFMGYESTDRAVYRAISMNFNEKLFGQTIRRSFTEVSVPYLPQSLAEKESAAAPCQHLETIKSATFTAVWFRVRLV